MLCASRSSCTYRRPHRDLARERSGASPSRVFGAPRPRARAEQARRSGFARTVRHRSERRQPEWRGRTAPGRLAGGCRALLGSRTYLWRFVRRNRSRSQWVRGVSSRSGDRSSPPASFKQTKESWRTRRAGDVILSVVCSTAEAFDQRRRCSARGAQGPREPSGNRSDPQRTSRPRP